MYDILHRHKTRARAIYTLLPPNFPIINLRIGCVGDGDFTSAYSVDLEKLIEIIFGSANIGHHNGTDEDMI